MEDLDERDFRLCMQCNKEKEGYNFNGTVLSLHDLMKLMGGYAVPRCGMYANLYRVEAV